MLVIALLLKAVTTEATDKPTIFASYYNHLAIFRPPYQFPIDDFDSPWGYMGLTYDGDYWWVTDYLNYAYQFDYGGGYVSSFVTPAPDPRGLAFDGEYLWISCQEGEYARVYQCELDGTPGPMGDFPVEGYAGLTFFQGNVLTLGNELYFGDIYVNFYAPDGTFIRELEILPDDSSDRSAIAITNDGSYLWITIFWIGDDDYIYKINPETGEYAGEYLWVDTSLSCSGLSYADWTYTEIETESLGKIKAIFK